MKKLKNQKEEQYHYFYVPNYPRTLAIINNKKSILENLYSLASFFWIMPNKQIWTQNQALFQQQIGETLNCSDTVDNTKNLIKNHETSVIICSASDLQKNITIFQEDIRQMKITHILCIGPSFLHNSKCISFVKNIDEMLKEIKKNKFSYNKSNDFINFIFVSKEIQDSSILVKTMFAMLQQETNRNQMLQYMGEVAKISCSPNKISQINQFVSKNINSEQTLSTPIRWYTKESFLYRFVNSILRLCKNTTAIYVLQPYFKDLFQSISELYLEQQKEKSDSKQNYRSFYCYRGASISEKEIQHFKSNINSIVENLGFLSTSSNIEVANEFAINVLYQIDVEDSPRQSQLDFGFAFVDKYSSKQGEQQIIFNPLNTFKIVDVDQIQQGRKLYLIRLKYGELARITACDKTQLNPEEMKYKILSQYRISEKSKYKLIGDVLVENDFNLQPTASLKYCEKYLQIALASKNEVNISEGYLRIGKYYLNIGQYDKMIQNFQKMHEIYQRNKENNPSYHSCLSALGTAYIKTCQFEKAIKYLSTCLKLSKNKSGTYTLNHIIILNNLSVAYINEKKYQKALKCLEEIKKMQKQTAGQNNQVYLNILTNIGTVHFKLGSYAKAIQYLQQVLQIDKISLGVDHPRCVRKYINLAAVYDKCHQYSKALPLFLKALAIQGKYFGSNTQFYVSILSKLGIIYLKLYKFQLSIDYLKKCKIFYEKYGTNSAPHLQILEYLGKAYNQLWNYKQSASYFQEIIKINEMQSREISYSYINALILLGNNLIALKNFEKAMQTLKKAQFLQNHYFAQDLFFSLQILISLAILHQKIGQLERGLNHLKRCKNIIQDAPHYISYKYYPIVWGQIGNFYMKSNQYHRSISYFEESQRIRKKISGENHWEYAKTLIRFGKAYQYLGQYQKALIKFKQLKNIIKELYGQNSQKYAETLNSIAMVHENLGQLSQAVKLYECSSEIIIKKFDQKHFLYLSALSRLSSIYFDLGLLQKSMESCQKFNCVMGKNPNKLIQDYESYFCEIKKQMSSNESLVEKISKKVKESKQIIKILLKYKNKIAMNYKPLKIKLSEIKQSIFQKKYDRAFKLINWLRRLLNQTNERYIHEIQELDMKQNEVMSIILSQISNYYEIANILEINGNYQQAGEIYSTFILMKYKEIAFAIHEVYRQVENDFEHIQVKIKNEKDTPTIKIDYVTETEVKINYCCLDFQL